MITLKEDEGLGHIYSTPIGDLPSVTTILKIAGGDKTGALMGWVAKLNAEYYEKLLNDIVCGKISLEDLEIDDVIKEGKALHRKKKSETADLGSLLHHTIEQYLKNNSFTIDDKIAAQFAEFQKWEDDIGLKIIKAEHPIFSRVGYAGTLDIYGTINNRRLIIDLKTSNAIYPDMAMQVGAYMRAVEEMEGVKLNGGGILRISREAKLEYKEWSIEELELAYQKFLCLVEYYKLSNKENKNV